MHPYRRSHAQITSALTFLGAAYASVVTLKIARFVWRHYVRPRTNLLKRYSDPTGRTRTASCDIPLQTSWAVVTGATSGIGRGCALALAQRGFHIILIARTAKDLEELAQELQTVYRIKTMVITMDAAECSETQVDDFIRQLENKSVAILVNSVGILNERPAFVDEMDFSLARSIIMVNCCFAVLLTSRLIPLLRLHASKHKCRAAILNVGSLTSSSPFALQATYAATKSFLAHWSRSLAAELQPDPIDVLCVRPGLTASSRMAGGPKIQAGGIVADANDFAQRALGMLGMGGCVSNVLPYPPHAFLDWVGTIVPESIQGSATRAMNLKRQGEMDQERSKLS